MRRSTSWRSGGQAHWRAPNINSFWRSSSVLSSAIILKFNNNTTTQRRGRLPLPRPRPLLVPPLPSSAAARLETPTGARTARGAPGTSPRGRGRTWRTRRRDGGRTTWWRGKGATSWRTAFWGCATTSPNCPITTRLRRLSFWSELKIASGIWKRRTRDRFRNWRGWKTGISG